MIKNDDKVPTAKVPGQADGTKDIWNTVQKGTKSVSNLANQQANYYAQQNQKLQNQGPVVNIPQQTAAALASNVVQPILNIIDKEEEKDEDKGKSYMSKIADKEQEKMEEAASDERLKRIFSDNDDAIKAFAKLNAIEFTYNDKAREIHPNGENHVDDDVHYGLKAQELAENPFTESTVSEDEQGYLQVDTPELTMANSAVISEICKRLEVIEKVLGIKVV